MALFFGLNRPSRYQQQQSRYDDDDDLVNLFSDDDYPISPFGRLLMDCSGNGPLPLYKRYSSLDPHGKKRSMSSQPTYRMEKWEKFISIPIINSKDIHLYPSHIVGNDLTIGVVHEEGDVTSDNGLTRRSFLRKVTLPEGCILSSISVDVADEEKCNIKVSGMKKVKATPVAVMGESAMEVGQGEDGAKAIKLDLAEYKAGDVKVKVIGNNVVVTAEHKDGSDGMYVHKRMERAFPLPPNMSPDEITSTISDEGILTITPGTSVPMVTSGDKSNGAASENAQAAK